MKSGYFLYRLDKECDAQIYGKFESLSQAKMSAALLLIRNFCFILSSDFTKIYFYNSDNNTWNYDILTDKGRNELFEIYPDPRQYKE
jgi:hypothetical protein